MPGELNAVEYYHYYQASQRRVERWVQKTDKELRAAATGSAAQTSSPVVVVNEEKKGKGMEDRSVTVQQHQQQHHQQQHRQGEQHDRRRRLERTSSSKHRTSDGRSHSHSRPSSGSKKIRTSHTSGLPGQPNPKASSRHAHPRRESSRTAYSTGDITLSSYLPYGVLPLLYAITGSPALSVIAAILLLAVYLYVDYDGPATKKRPTSSP
ncbi:hypothetical protein CVT25_001832 [Psilocybe cyanescens]|uniref:Uncharacterized protein n=1 Tax=Psilocybe cyanescens TaxID=93625 RepID=A0A409WQE2_PSICY|nr:hypothetical protein CVT25_001832 [Psilocybe cyanescens]